MRKGFTLTDLLIAVGVILLVGGLIVWATVDARRRSRDTERVSEARQLQAMLDLYRIERASYPTALEDIPDVEQFKTTFRYAPQPEGCGADQASICGSYTAAFSLEGRVGTLVGGNCAISPEGLTCTRPR
jgi:type II secretory pathway pseudopilin PulG